MNRWRDWWRQSELEARAAEDLLTTGHHAWCCFTFQQSAEKAIKALLEQQNLGIEGHNLNQLIRRLPGTPPQSVLGACSRLNRLYIPTRYPDAVPSGAPVDQYFEAGSPR